MKRQSREAVDQSKVREEMEERWSDQSKAVDKSKNAKLTVDQGVKGCVRKAGGSGGRQLRKAEEKKKKKSEK